MKSMAYVGMDVHKESISVYVLPGVGDEAIVEKRIENDLAKVRKLFLRWSREHDLRCCYEASGAGYVLQRWLTGIGVFCEVVAPSLIPRRPGERIKNDRRDARKLARLYRAGELTSIRVPSEEDESLRSLVRCRETFAKEARQSQQYILKFLRLRGIIWQGKSNWTQEHWRWLERLCFEGYDRTVWQEYLTLLQYKLSRLEDLDKEIAKAAFSEGLREQVSLLCCLRGIDIQSAMVIVTEIGDFRRFATPGQLMSYLGLVPSEDSSGGVERRGRITKSGNSRCRRVLVQAAWKYAHKPALGKALKARQAGQPAEVVRRSWDAQHRLYKKFHSVAHRKERCKAVVAAARELVGFIWAIMTGYEKRDCAEAA
jgi:transposase